VKAEISFDFVMDEDMYFVEGTYRMDGGVWQVFIFAHAGVTKDIGVRTNLVWESGVTGLNVIVANDAKLNKQVVLQTLSDVLGVTQWTEVRGPDSIMLR
jgi:adenosylcobinamide amidohydrolase